MRKVSAVLLAAALLFMTFASFSSVGASSSSGVIVPLYSYPGSVWTSLIQDHQASPSVPIIAIINPGNGPCNSAGPCPDPNYESGIQSLTSAGITVAGYVYTSYATRSLSSVESDIASYKSWYVPDGLSGIMFDEMNNSAATEGYYQTLANYVHSEGMSLTIGNPGDPVPSGFIGIFNIYNIYEQGGLPSISTLSSATAGYPSSNFGMIAFSVSSTPTQSYVTSASSYVSWMYITDAIGPPPSSNNPYTRLPVYFTTLLSELSPVSTTTSTTGGTGGTTSSTATSSTSVSSSTTCSGILCGLSLASVSINQSQAEVILVVIAAVVTIAAARKIT